MSILQNPLFTLVIYRPNYSSYCGRNEYDHISDSTFEIIQNSDQKEIARIWADEKWQADGDSKVSNDCEYHLLINGHKQYEWPMEHCDEESVVIYDAYEKLYNDTQDIMISNYNVYKAKLKEQEDKQRLLHEQHVVTLARAEQQAKENLERIEFERLKRKFGG